MLKMRKLDIAALREAADDYRLTEAIPASS
jgi:hypothetical protein